MYFGCLYGLTQFANTTLGAFVIAVFGIWMFFAFIGSSPGLGLFFLCMALVAAVKWYRMRFR